MAVAVHCCDAPRHGLRQKSKPIDKARWDIRNKLFTLCHHYEHFAFVGSFHNRNKSKHAPIRRFGSAKTANKTASSCEIDSLIAKRVFFLLQNVSSYFRCMCGEVIGFGFGNLVRNVHSHTFNCRSSSLFEIPCGALLCAPKWNCRRRKSILLCSHISSFCKSLNSEYLQFFLWLSLLYKRWMRIMRSRKTRQRIDRTGAETKSTQFKRISSRCYWSKGDAITICEQSYTVSVASRISHKQLKQKWEIFIESKGEYNHNERMRKLFNFRHIFDMYVFSPHAQCLAAASIA